MILSIDGNDKEQLYVRELQLVPNGKIEEIRFFVIFSHTGCKEINSNPSRKQVT